MNRRKLLYSAMVTAGGCFTLSTVIGKGEAPMDIQTDWQRLLPAGRDFPQPSDKISRSDAEWRSLLGDLQYDVMRKEATEPTFHSELNGEKRDGIYVCAGCELPVFSSDMKFDSGTGWPSFFTTIPGVFDTKRDWALLLPRTEYHCVRCGSHHGHVFNDGPDPTGKRWCNNGVALQFLPA